MIADIFEQWFHSIIQIIRYLIKWQRFPIRNLNQAWNFSIFLLRSGKLKTINSRKLLWVTCQTIRTKYHFIRTSFSSGM